MSIPTSFVTYNIHVYVKRFNHKSSGRLNAKSEVARTVRNGRAAKADVQMPEIVVKKEPSSDKLYDNEDHNVYVVDMSISPAFDY